MKINGSFVSSVCVLVEAKQELPEYGLKKGHIYHLNREKYCSIMNNRELKYTALDSFKVAKTEDGRYYKILDDTEVFISEIS